MSHEPGAIHQEEGKVQCIRQSERRTACWIRTQAVHTAKHGSRAGRIRFDRKPPILRHDATRLEKASFPVLRRKQYRRA